MKFNREDWDFVYRPDGISTAWPKGHPFVECEKIPMNFIIAMRLEVRDSTVSFAISPDLEYCLIRRVYEGGRISFSYISRKTQDRDKFPNWPFPEPEVVRP